MKYIWKLVGWEHEKVGREPRPVGIGAHLEKNRRTRGLARRNPQQNAQAHQGSRPGRCRGVEVDGHSDLVARRHHLHWRILQECREAYLLQGRVSEGSGPSLQLESRRKRTPRDRHPRRRRGWRVRLQGARSPSSRPQQFWQVETFEESEALTVLKTGNLFRRDETVNVEITITLNFKTGAHVILYFSFIYQSDYWDYPLRLSLIVRKSRI